MTTARHRSLGGVFSLTRRSKVRCLGKPENICSVPALPVLTQNSHAATLTRAQRDFGVSLGTLQGNVVQII
jgi:hypothetical protein